MHIIGLFFCASILSTLAPLYGLFRLSKDPTSNHRLVSYFLILLGVLFIVRGPTLFLPYGLNPDESQVIAQAITFAERPIPWTHLDTTTSGPLNSWVLMLPYLLGIDPGFATARITAILLIWGSILATYGGIRTFLPRLESAACMLMPAYFWAFAGDPDFLHTSSELFPIFIIAAGSYFLLCSFKDTRKRNDLLIGIACLSLIPFTKLQATVIAIPAVAVAVLHHFSSRGLRNGVQMLPVILLSGCLLPFLILLPVFLSGGIEHFYRSYLEFSFSYGNSISVGGSITNIFKSKFLSDAMPFAVMGAITLLAICAQNVASNLRTQKWTIFESTHRWQILFIITILLSAVYAIIKPGTYFSHYLQFLILPITMLLAVFASELRKIGEYSIRFLPVVGVCSTIILSSITFSFESPYILHWLNPSINQHIQNSASFINQTKQPGDQMVVWGWESDLYIHTQLPSGTREVLTPLIAPNIEEHCPFLFVPPGNKTYYQDRFLEDIQQSKPAYVVDSVHSSSLMMKHPSLKLEGFPPFADWIQKHYTLQFDSGDDQESGVRVWMRNDLTKDRMRTNFSGSEPLLSFHSIRFHES